VVAVSLCSLSLNRIGIARPRQLKRLFSGFGQLKQHVVSEQGARLQANCGPNGPKFNEQLRVWALEHYLGVIEEEPVPVRLSDDALARYVGTYETIVVLCDIIAADGQLVTNIRVKPEMRETLREAGQDPDEPQPELPLGDAVEGRRPLHHHGWPGQGHEGLLPAGRRPDGERSPPRWPPRDQGRVAGFLICNGTVRGCATRRSALGMCLCTDKPTVGCGKRGHRRALLGGHAGHLNPASGELVLRPWMNQ